MKQSGKSHERFRKESGICTEKEKSGKSKVRAINIQKKSFKKYLAKSMTYSRKSQERVRKVI